MVINNLTLDNINKCFYEEGGLLKWKIRKANTVHIGDIAGYNTGKGYLRVELDGKLFYVHRILYQIYYNLNVLDNYFTIDHIDGDPLNNCKYNLRLANHSENIHNSKKRKDNTSGHKDIYCHRNGKYFYWTVQIRLNNIGYSKKFPYSDIGLNQAIEYRNFKLKELHKEFSNTGEST